MGYIDHTDLLGIKFLKWLTYICWNGFGMCLLLLIVLGFRVEPEMLPDNYVLGLCYLIFYTSIFYAFYRCFLFLEREFTALYDRREELNALKNELLENN